MRISACIILSAHADATIAATVGDTTAVTVAVGWSTIVIGVMAAVVAMSPIVRSVMAVATVDNGHAVVTINRSVIAIVRSDDTPFVDRAATGAVTATIRIAGSASIVTGFGFLRQGDESKEDTSECDE